MEYNSLEEENKVLREKLASFENKKKDRWKKGVKASKFISTKLLGSRLKDAITNFFTELEEKKNVSKDTLSELLTAIFLRITRIGFFLLITTLLPTLLILLQVYYLRNQNQLIRTQNNRLDQQTYLQEASRRSYMIGVLDGMIKDVTSRGENVSKSNITRLIALSKNLKPYKYLENDHLIPKQLSPERGYLLLALLESDLNLNKVIDFNTKETIISALDFSYAELRNTDLTQLDLAFMDLNNSTLDNSNFTKSTFSKGIFDDASLVNVNLGNSDILNCSFKNANMKGINFANSYISKCNFNNADLSNANFTHVDLRKSSFENAQINGVAFDKAEVTSDWMAKMERELDTENFEYFEDNFQLQPKDKKVIIIRKKQ